MVCGIVNRSNFSKKQFERGIKILKNVHAFDLIILLFAMCPKELMFIIAFIYILSAKIIGEQLDKFLIMNHKPSPTSRYKTLPPSRDFLTVDAILSITKSNHCLV